MKSVAVGNRTFMQKYLTDPLVGLIVALLLLIFKILPLPVSRLLGRNLGFFVGLFMIRRNKIALLNMQFAFPEKTLKERKKILRGMWRHYGRLGAEIFHIPQVMKKVHFKGREEAIHFYKQGKGGFLCSAHIGNWELPFAQYICPDFKLNPVFRTANNPYLNKLLFKRREGVLIPKGLAGTRTMIQVLKQGQFISILCDQKFREGITVPFFGQPAQTATSVATLALKYDLPILMARCIYQSDGRYLVEISKPLELPKDLPRDQAELKIMTHINPIYEKWIRQNPEQWLSIHRRFDKKVYREHGIR
jgi:KDO2-lipid IV(A) lauroyltransferase